MVIQVRESGPPLADDALADLERRLGITLPAEYRAFLLAHNGGVPRPEWFRLPVREEWIATRRSVGGMRWFGYCYNNGRMAEYLKDWHRLGRFLGIGGDSDTLDFETRLPRAVPRAAGGTRCCCRRCVFSGQRLALHRHHGRRTGPEWRVVLARRGAGRKRGRSCTCGASLAALCETLRPLGASSPDWRSLVEYGDLEELRRWLERNGRRLREKDDREWTALDYAVFERRWEIARFLMEKRDVTPEMVFYDAMVDGRFSTAPGMLHFGVDREFLEPSLARKSAEFWVDLDLVRALVDAGANVDHVDNDASPGNSPLHFAAHAGAVEAVRLLLEQGADPAVKNDEGRLPQDLASGAGYIDLAVVLDQAVTARPAPPDLAREPEAVDLHKVTIRDAMPGLDKDALKELEQRLGTRLPGEYRAFLKRFNGGVPSPACFAFRGDDDDQAAVRCEVTRFLAVGAAPSSLGEPLDLEAIREQLADWGLPKRCFRSRTPTTKFRAGCCASRCAAKIAGASSIIRKTTAPTRRRTDSPSP